MVPNVNLHGDAVMQVRNCHFMVELLGYVDREMLGWEGRRRDPNGGDYLSPFWDSGSSEEGHDRP